jgi:hypothetical protein
MRDSFSTSKQKEQAASLLPCSFVWHLSRQYWELRDRGACCLCGLTYAGIWGFDLLNSAQHEEEAEYSNDENSTCDQEIGGKASTISHETCYVA